MIDCSRDGGSGQIGLSCKKFVFPIFSPALFTIFLAIALAVVLVLAMNLANVFEAVFASVLAMVRVKLIAIIEAVCYHLLSFAIIALS